MEVGVRVLIIKLTITCFIPNFGSFLQKDSYCKKPPSTLWVKLIKLAVFFCWIIVFIFFPVVFCGELLAIYSDQVERSRYLFLLNRSLGDAYLYDNFQYHLVIFQQKFQSEWLGCTIKCFDTGIFSYIRIHRFIHA